MPILKAGRPRRIPQWADLSDWGVSRQARGNCVETHYHDAVETVVIVSGKVRVRTEGVSRDLGPGDTVITRMGETHSWLALRKSVSVWMVSRLRGCKRPGHLIRKR
ncbi:MAG: cupin domain-containing protein [Candidatus Coatesbacteria bacterium]